MSSTDVEMLPVGHPARPVAGRALALAAGSAALFTLFAFVSTQVSAVRAGSPWQDDPYDAVVTFTLFFVPGLSGVAALRALLCRRTQPLPVFRVDQLLRTAVLILVLIDITAGVDWIALILRTNRHLWNGGTPWLVAGLAVVTAAAVVTHLSVRRARSVTPRHRLGDGDWLGDIVAGVALIAARTGDPARFSGLRRFLVVVIRFVRAHFTVLAALGSILCGLAVVARLNIAEGVADRALFAIEAVVFAGGTFGFVMIADAWLQLAVSPDNRKHSLGRICATAAAVALPVSLALRDPIWAALGHASDIQSTGQLAGLTLASAAVCAVLAATIAYVLTRIGRRA